MTAPSAGDTAAAAVALSVALAGARVELAAPMTSAQAAALGGQIRAALNGEFTVAAITITGPGPAVAVTVTVRPG